MMSHRGGGGAGRGEDEFPEAPRGGAGLYAIDKLTSFVTEAKKKGCKRIELRQLSLQGESAVRSWSGEELDSREPDEIAEGIYETAELDATDGLRGVNKYAALCYLSATKRARHEGRVMFQIDVQNHRTDAIEETEAPSLLGFLGQKMRHDEVQFRTTTLAINQIIQHYQTILREQRERIAHLEGQHTEVMELRERLRSEDAERQLEVAREKRKDDMFKSLEPLVAGIAMKMLGPSAKLPDGAGGMHTMGEEILTRFLNSLDAAQFEQISAVLKPEQRAALFEWINSRPQGPDAPKETS